MNLNIKAEKQNTYDAIVVGSGISGGWAAKELTEKGLKVLLLERGRNVEHIKDYYTALLKPWEFKHRGRITPEQQRVLMINTTMEGVRLVFIFRASGISEINRRGIIYAGSTMVAAPAAQAGKGLFRKWAMVQNLKKKCPVRDHGIGSLRRGFATL